MDRVRPTPTVISLPLSYRPGSRWIPLGALVVAVGLLRLDNWFGYVMLFLAVVTAWSVWRLERFRRSEVGSMRALVAERPSEPFGLVPVVTDARLGTRLRVQFLLRDTGGVDRAMAWIVPDRERFDPRSPVFVHGVAKPGQSVALASESGRTALLPYGPLRAVPGDAAEAAARAAPLVSLLGWGPDSLPSGSPSDGPAPVRAGTRIGPDQFGGDRDAASALDRAMAASTERVEWVRRHVDSSPLVVLVLIAIGFSGGFVWWLPLVLLAAAWFSVVRLRAWQIGPLAQHVAATFAVSKVEASKLGMAYLGMHGAKLPSGP